MSQLVIHNPAQVKCISSVTRDGGIMTHNVTTQGKRISVTRGWWHNERIGNVVQTLLWPRPSVSLCDSEKRVVEGLTML